MDDSTSSWQEGSQVTDPQHGIQQFFEAMSSGDVTSSADLFHDPFLSLDPTGAAVVGREQLRAALPAREAMFASVGARRSQLRDVQTTVLDDQHVLARTIWTMTMDKPDARPLTLESTYLLRRDGKRWSAVVYLNHHDVRSLATAR